MEIMGQIIEPDAYRTDTPGAYFSDDKAQPFETIFLSGGCMHSTAIVVAGVRSVSAVFEDKRATALRSDKQPVYSFLVATDNTTRWLTCSYLDESQAHMDRSSLLLKIDGYWLK